MKPVTISSSAVVLEDMVLVSRHLKDLKKGLSLEQKVLGLGLDRMVLVLVLRLKSRNFQDLHLFLLGIKLCPKLSDERTDHLSEHVTYIFL